MIESIKKRLLDRSIKRQLEAFKKNESQQDFPQSIHSLKHFLFILSDNPVPEGERLFFKSGLKKIYGPVIISELRLSDIKPEECNWFRLPAEPYMRRLKEKKIDMVVDFNQDAGQMSAYLAAFCDAGLRLNITSGLYDDVYNLHFRSSSSNTLTDQLNIILNYLKTFKLASGNREQK